MQSALSVCPSIHLSVCFHSIFRTSWPLALSFCMCGSLPWLAGYWKWRSQFKVKVRVMIKMQLVWLWSLIKDSVLVLLLAWRYFSAGICYHISVCLCVCLYVTPVLCMKTAKCFVKILLLPDSPIILVFHHRGLLLNSDIFTPNGGAEYKEGEKNWRFLTNKSVYLGNSARSGHSYYRSWIGNHTQAIKWWHFR